MAIGYTIRTDPCTSGFSLFRYVKLLFSLVQFKSNFLITDEPEMKATFDISLGHHKMYNSLSNMPLKETRSLGLIEDFVMDTFETSVAMSTYLVAYCVSDFVYKESIVSMKDEVKFRIYARRDAMNQVDYAAEVGPKVLKFYEVICKMSHEKIN